MTEVTYPSIECKERSNTPYIFNFEYHEEFSLITEGDGDVDQILDGSNGIYISRETEFMVLRKEKKDTFVPLLLSFKVKLVKSVLVAFYDSYRREVFNKTVLMHFIF